MLWISSFRISVLKISLKIVWVLIVSGIIAAYLYTNKRVDNANYFDFDESLERVDPLLPFQLISALN